MHGMNSIKCTYKHWLINVIYLIKIIIYRLTSFVHFRKVTRV